MQIDRRQHRKGRGWDVPLPATDSEQTLVLVFGAPRYDEIDAPFSELREAYPHAVIAGCSTAGEILQDEIYDDSLSVAVVRFDQTRLRLASCRLADQGSTSAGTTLARTLKEDDLKHVLVLSDGLRVNGTELVGGINAELADDVVVTGGLAGDGADFGTTWVVVDGRPVTGHVTCIGFYGDVQVGYGSRGGWDAFGIERTVTRSDGNVLFELDGQPALKLYKEYLGERADELPASGLLFPLRLKGRGRQSGDVVRTILAVDDDAQSLTFAGDVPEGTKVQLMHANFDRLVEGAEGAALACDAQGPVLAIAVSCVGRRLVLGERADEEVEVTLGALPEGSSMVGFYSYGELSPLASGTCDLHNQTMTLTTYRER